LKKDLKRIGILNTLGFQTSPFIGEIGLITRLGEEFAKIDTKPADLAEALEKYASQIYDYQVANILWLSRR